MNQRPTFSSTVGIGIVIGAAIGVLAGALFTGNVDLGWAIIIGAGLGVVFAAVLDMRKRGTANRGGARHDE